MTRPRRVQTVARGGVRETFHGWGSWGFLLVQKVLFGGSLVCSSVKYKFIKTTFFTKSTFIKNHFDLKED